MIVEAHITVNATKAAVRAAVTDITRFTWVYDQVRTKIELWEPKG